MTNTFAQVLRTGGTLASVIAALTVGTLIVSTSLKVPVTDSQVLFSNNGVVTGDSGMTYSSSTDVFTVSKISFGNATGTNIEVANTSSTNATTTNLYLRTSMLVKGQVAVVGADDGSWTIGNNGQFSSSYSGTALNVGSGTMTIGANASFPSIQSVRFVSLGNGYGVGADNAYGAATIGAGSGGTFNVIRVTPTSTLLNSLVIPTTTAAISLGAPDRSWLNIYASGTAFMQNVSSTTVTTTHLWVKNGGTLNDPGIRFGGFATGFNGNTANQIGVVVNGNSFGTIDASNYWQAPGYNPLGDNVGELGRLTLRWKGAYLMNVTSSKIVLNDLNITGTSTDQIASTSYTINATNFSFKFPAAATSVIINDSFVRGTTSTHVQVTVADFDATMFYAQVTTTAVGQIRVRAPAAPTADTKVNVLIINER